MKNRRLFFCISLVLISVSCTTRIAAPVRTEPDLTAGNLLEHIMILAPHDDARIAGFPGERKAAEYITSFLKSEGYTVRFSKFEIPAFKRNYLTLKLEKDAELMPIEAKLFYYSGDTGGKPLKMNIYDGVVGRPEDLPDRLPPDTAVLMSTRFYSYPELASRAIEAGAAAVILYAYVQDAFSGTVLEPVDVPVMGVGYDDIKTLLHRKDSIEECVEIECSVELFPSSSGNIIACKKERPADEPYLIIGAHYDSVETPGANDNGSGAALLMELARKLPFLDLPFAVELVFFGAEEPGLLGSAAYAERMTETENCLGMINFDVVGEGTSIGVHAEESEADSVLFEMLTEYLDAGGYAWKVRRHAYSDHVSFAEHGIPSVMICAMPMTTLHTDADTIDCINPDIMVVIGNIVCGFLQKL